MALQFLLDTNTCMYIINRRPPQVAERFARYAPDAIGLSSITLAELTCGVTKSRSSRNEAVLRAFIAPLEIAPFEDAHSWRYGEIRAALEAVGTPIGPLETLIAAHALALGLTLVTHNTGEFERVPGLQVQNWFPAPPK